MSTDMQAFCGGLEKTVCAMGAKAFGVADLDKLKTQAPDLLDFVAGDYSRAIVLGVRLQKAALAGIAGEPTAIYFHNYRQVNYRLDSAALTIADRIQEEGFRSLAVPASQIIREKPMCGHIAHRLLGQAAGIGFRGRNNLLVHPKYGAQLRYVSVLTDMPLEPDIPYVGDCGSCRACVAVCPAGAIRETAADFELKTCCQKLREFRKIRFIGQHICGVCVKACGENAESRTNPPHCGETENRQT